MGGQSGHGGVRSCIMDGSNIVCVGYVGLPEPGFKFVADESRPAVWKLDSSGNVVSEQFLAIEGLGQLAKIRKDAGSGFIACSTGWGTLGGADVNVVALVKFSNSLSVEWSKTYGMAGGNSQVFDMFVDNDGNYLMGGHTTVGTGVVNWDYLALKVNSQTKQVEWRKTFGQPRGFDPQYIHDEMYGVKMDLAGNYLLMGGSGDEYSYTATNAATGWMSDVWVSYLIVLDPQGNTLYTNVYGDKAGNNAGEYLAVDPATSDVMVFVDSDTLGGAFGFLKLTPTNSPPTAGPPAATTTALPPATTTLTPATTTKPPTGPPSTTPTPTTTTTESEDYGSEENGSEEYGSEENDSED